MAVHEASVAAVGAVLGPGCPAPPSVLQLKAVATQVVRTVAGGVVQTGAEVAHHVPLGGGGGGEGVRV